MGKDPAFLFYPNDFIAGTRFMTDEQIGKYIRLLCAQFDLGHLKEAYMLKICGKHDDEIFSKFDIDSQGLYFNKRLELEAIKRKAYSESRRKNRSHMNNICKSYVQHMENENRDVNINKNKRDRESVREKERFKLEAKEILEFLNKEAGRTFRPVEANLDFIIARLKSGATMPNCKGVIVRKCRDWKGTDQEKYLRPETLFNKTKFESYLGERSQPICNAVNAVPNIPDINALNVTIKNM